MADRSHWNFANSADARYPCCWRCAPKGDLNAAVLRARKALEKAAAKDDNRPPGPPARALRAAGDTQRRATLADIVKFLRSRAPDARRAQPATSNLKPWASGSAFE